MSVDRRSIIPITWDLTDAVRNGPMFKGKSGKESEPLYFHQTLYADAQQAFEQLSMHDENTEPSAWVETMPASRETHFIRGFTKWSSEHQCFHLFTYTDEEIGPPLVDRPHPIPPWGSKSKAECMEIFKKEFHNLVMYTAADLMEAADVAEEVEDPVGGTLTATYKMKPLPGVGKQALVITTKLAYFGENKALGAAWISTDHPDAVRPEGYTDLPCLGGIMISDTHKNIWYKYEVVSPANVPAPNEKSSGGLCSRCFPKKAKVLDMVHESFADSSVRMNEFVNEGMRSNSSIKRPSAGGILVSRPIPDAEVPKATE